MSQKNEGLVQLIPIFCTPFLRLGQHVPPADHVVLQKSEGPLQRIFVFLHGFSAALTASPAVSCLWCLRSVSIVVCFAFVFGWFDVLLFVWIKICQDLYQLCVRIVWDVCVICVASRTTNVYDLYKICIWRFVKDVCTICKRIGWDSYEDVRRVV